MPCLKLLNDVDCLKFSGTNAQMLALKVDIDLHQILQQRFYTDRGFQYVLKTWPDYQ